MQRYQFDFDTIPGQAAFYQTFCLACGLPANQITNLDSLWDALVSGAVPLPAEVEFLHLDSKARRRYGALILLFDEAEEELEGLLRFNIILP